MAKKRKNAANEQPGGDGPSQSLYEILGVERTASQEEIRKAYHRLALRLHPDKNPGDKEANSKFQSLQSVFAVLGDPEKRAIYDETGSVEDIDLVGESGKSLYEFFRALYKTVTEKDIEEFAVSYRGSEQEKKDLKDLYISCKGNMNKVFQMLMCSDPHLDSHRFMEVIDAAIAAGELEEKRSYRKWAKETAKRPAPADPLAPSKSKEEAATSSDLVAAIRTRGQQNMDSLVSALEAKYSKKHKQPAEEPSEEAFQAARAKINARKARKK